MRQNRGKKEKPQAHGFTRTNDPPLSDAALRQKKYKKARALVLGPRQEVVGYIRVFIKHEENQ